MADFNEIKETVLGAFGVAAEKTKEFAGKAADKAKDVSKITKLSFEIKAAKETIEKAYAEIGKIYYETHKNAPADYFIQLCEEITAANERIEALEIEIDKVKAGCKNDDGSIDVEFTEVTPEESAVSESDFAKPTDAPAEKPEDKPDDTCYCN
jgi:predicted  nucleic acid-binding Zn-ribbon protein